MKTIFKLLTIFIFFSFTAVGVFAMDFGVTIDNATGFEKKNGPVEFTQRDKVALWFEGDLSENFSIASQISYTFALDRYVLLSPDLLRFGGEFVSEGKPPFLFGFDAGRFRVSDFSGKVLNHKLDGVKLRAGLPFMTATASVGYTGLYQAPNCSIIMSKSDLAGMDYGPNQIFGPWGPYRLVETVNISFSELFLRQTIKLGFLFQQDLRPAAELSEDGGKVHTQYYGIGFDGPIVSPLFYNAFFYFNTGKTDQGYIFGFLTGGGLDLYLTKALFQRISLDFYFASGDADYDNFYEGNTEGDALGFLPISISAGGLVFSPQLSNTFYGAATYSIKPLSMIDHPAAQNFSVVLNGYPFFRSTTGPVSASGVADDSDSLYLGTELDFSLKARILSDLGLSYSMGFFFPGTAMENTNVQFLGRFELSLSI